MAAASATSPVLHDYGPDSGGRLKGVKVVKPVVVGNVAKYFGKKREEDGHTHQWTVFLRPYLSEDYSGFIKKVQFKLHDSYPNPTRIVTKPPYEVTETGWGEFEIAVKVHFNDPVERPVTMYHVLKLFEANKDPAGPPIIKKTISSETYDEIVFMEPTKLMKSLLDNIKPMKMNWKPETDIEEKKKLAIQSITQARSVVKSEIEMLRNKLKLSRETINSFKTQLTEAQSQQSATSTDDVKAAVAVVDVIPTVAPASAATVGTVANHPSTASAAEISSSNALVAAGIDSVSVIVKTEDSDKM